MDISTNCIDPHELVEEQFLLISEYKYGIAHNNPSFKLQRGFDYFDMFTVLCFFYYPEPTTQSLLSDLEAIKMAPIDKTIFNHHSLTSYNDYVMKYEIYIIRNAAFIQSLSDPSVLSDQFIRNLSFDTKMLDVTKLKLKSFQAVIAEIAKFVGPHTALLENSFRPLPAPIIPAISHQVQNKSPPLAQPASSPPRTFTCWNCEGRSSPATTVAHDYKKCSLACRFCGSFCRDHPDPKKAYCDLFRAFRNEKYAEVRAARGSHPGSDRSTKVTTPGSTPSPILYHTCLSSASVIRNNLPIIDSGATYSCVNNISHISPYTLSTPIPPNSLGVVTLGDNITHLPIEGVGNLVGDTNIPVKFVPQLGESVISVADIVDSDNIVFFDKTNMYSISFNDVVENKYNEFLDFVRESNLVSFTSTRACDRLYRLDQSPLITHPATPDPLTSTTTLDSTSVSPSSPISTPSVIHIVTSSPPGSTLEELVSFYHNLWNHCTKQMMISNINNKVYTPIPRQLTADAINTYFPKHCIACSIGSMKTKSHPKQSIPRHIDPGAEIQVDIQVWYSTGNKHTIAYNGAKYNLTCVDLATDYTWCYSLRDMKYLCRYLELLRLVILRHHRKLLVIRCDNQLYTNDIRDWALQEEVGIQLLPCIPHEHYQIGRVERKHQTLHNAVLKALALPHLNSRFWYMALKDAVFKSNIQSKSRLSGSSSYQLWFGTTPDLTHHPILPFGTIVMAHVPLHLQNKFSGAAKLTYYVGCAPEYYGGILLWDPNTTKTCVRRTYKVLGPTIADDLAPIIVLDAPTDDEIINYDYSFDDIEPMDIISPITVSPRVTRSSLLPEQGVLLTETGVPPVRTGADRAGADRASADWVTADGVLADTADHMFFEALGPAAEEADVMDNYTDSNLNTINQSVDVQVSRQLENGIKPSHLPSIVSALDMYNAGSNNDITDITEKGVSTPCITPHIPIANLMHYVIRDPKTNKIKRFRRFFKYINTHIDDLTTHESFIISAVCTPQGAVTPYFQYYDTDKFDNPPTDMNDYEYTPCIELLSDPDTHFHPITPRIYNVTATDYSLPDIPMTVEMMYRHPHRALLEEALNKELQSYVTNGAITASTLTPAAIKAAGFQLLTVRILFTIKTNPDGSFLKYKVRMVLRGDRWKNLDNIDLYASTVKMDSIRLVYSLICNYQLEIAFFDVETAFLIPPLHVDEEIYIKRPSQLTDVHMPAISKVNKCIYGLPQAARYFEDHFNASMASLGYHSLIGDPKIFIKRTGDSYVIVCTHVDDNLVAATSIELRNEFLHDIANIYKVTVDLDPQRFLGVHIHRDRANHTLEISQPVYIKSLLEKHNIPLISSHYPPTPMISSDGDITLSSPIVSPLLDASGITNYQSRIGGLLYLAIMTRPDILYAVIHLSQYNQHPTANHFAATDRILHYLAGTINMTLKYHRVSSSSLSLSLHAFADASYNVHKDNKSHTGYLVCIGAYSAPLLYGCKKQSITADSSTVAELIAAHSVTKELQWCINMLTELGFSLSSTPLLLQDNMSTIKIFNQKGNKGKTKHISLRYNIVRELCSNGTLNIQYCPTEDMIADILTKALGPSAFLRLRPLLMGHQDTAA